jgi:hypothetical protein
MPMEDSYNAATAVRHNLTIITGNDHDFGRPGRKVFNPSKELWLTEQFEDANRCYPYP